MKKRSLSLIVTLCAVTMLLTADPAFAGRKHHERWKGIAIGVGAAILGNAILNHDRHHHVVRVPERRYEPVPVPPGRRPRHRGYWEIRDEWIPPTYKSVWNPGHYNRKGDWIEGTWIKIVKRQGHWKEKKVWVAASRKKHRRRH